MVATCKVDEGIGNSTLQSSYLGAKPNCALSNRTKTVRNLTELVVADSRNISFSTKVIGNSGARTQSTCKLRQVAVCNSCGFISKRLQGGIDRLSNRSYTSERQYCADDYGKDPKGRIPRAKSESDHQQGQHWPECDQSQLWAERQVLQHDFPD